jgi:hypothetical protein
MTHVCAPRCPEIRGQRPALFGPGPRRPASSGKVGASIPLFQFATAKPFARPKALAHASGGAPLR